MDELVNLGKESLSSDLSQQLFYLKKESNEIIQKGKEEKPLPLDVNENELYEVLKETVTFVTQIKIEENPDTYICDACCEAFQKESELNSHNCSRTLKEQHSFTHNLESGFLIDSGKKISLTVKVEDSASCDVRGKFLGESESKIHEGNLSVHMYDVREKDFKEEPETKSRLRPRRKGENVHRDRKPARIDHLKRRVCNRTERKYNGEKCPEGSSRSRRGIAKEKKAKPFACAVCGRGFPDEFKMKMHHIGHTVEAPFVCDVCKREFSKKQHLVRHIYIHTGERPFVCEVCNKGFYRPSELKIHAVAHDEERKIRCEFCGKGFLRENSLKIHLRNHTGEKPFECSVCGKGFSQACDLRIHSYIHTEERPFACDVCGKGFYKRSFLVNHRRVHDKADRSVSDVADDPGAKGTSVEGKNVAELKSRTHNSSRGKDFLCTFCLRGFCTQRSLKVHLRNHSEKTPAVRSEHHGNHKKVNRSVRKKKADNSRSKVSFARRTDHSLSNQTSGDHRTEASLVEKADHSVLIETSNDSSAEISSLDVEWVPSAPTRKSSRTRGSCSRRSVSQTRLNNSSQSRIKAGTVVDDASPVEIHSRGKKVTRQRKEKSIVPGAFACNKCNKVYSHLQSLKRHLQTHLVKTTGVNRSLSIQRVKAPDESLEEKVYLFAPFKNYV